MNDEKKLFVKNYLRKAEETPIDAQINIDNNRFNAAQNRIYYAIFYSVVSLGYCYGFITSKHKQLLGWFNKSFIHEKKIFSSELFLIYDKAFTDRQETDYEIHPPKSKTELLESLTEAKHFVQEITNHITQFLSTKSDEKDDV